MKRRKTEQLILTGPAPYIERMAAHLKEEHPSTRRRLRVQR